MNTPQDIIQQINLPDADLAELLGCKADTIRSIMRGKFEPSQGMLGDMVQVAEDVAYWSSLVAKKLEFASELPNAIILQKALDNYIEQAYS